MPLAPVSPMSSQGLFLTAAPDAVDAPAAPAQPDGNPYGQGDKSTLSEGLKAKLTGKVPGALSFQTLSFKDLGELSAVNVPALRQAALQARQPHGTTHEAALRARKTALIELQTGAQAGSPVSAIAGATLSVLDSDPTAGLFRLTEFADRVLDWVAKTGNEQFAVTPGITVAEGLQAMAKGLTETRGLDPTADGLVYAAALHQAAQLSAPGSYVAGLVKAHEDLAKQLSSPRDKAQLAEAALSDLKNATAYDVLMGGGAKSLRTFARAANWVLSGTDAERITLKSAALRTIAQTASPNSKVAFVANGALRIVAAASSLAEQDAALQGALATISTAADGEF